MEQHVFIVGSKGIPAACGGFETFVEALVENQVNKNIKYHVACMDSENREDKYLGAHCFHVKTGGNDASCMASYDRTSLQYTISYIKKHKIESPIVYVLSCRIGSSIKGYAEQIHSLGGKLYVNPNDDAWERDRQNKPIRNNWKNSEKGVIKHADLLICDSPTIELYLRKEYKKFHPETTYIAFDAELIGDGKKTELMVELYEDLFLPQDGMRHCSVRRPMISVCLASYNGEHYIREQMESILKQLGEQDELLISDDGSKDGTLAIVEEMQANDARIRLIQGPGLGVKQNVANAMSHSKLAQADYSGYLFLSDQDDVWEEDKVEKVLDAFAKTGADLVVHDVTVVDESLEQVLMDSFFEYRGSGAGFWKNMMKNSYMGCAMALRSSVIEDSLPIPNNIAMHDWWIGVRNDLHGKGTCFLPDKLIKYRRHGENVSDFDHNSLPVMLANRLVFLRELWRV